MVTRCGHRILNMTGFRFDHSSSLQNKIESGLNQKKKLNRIDPSALDCHSSFYA